MEKLIINQMLHIRLCVQKEGPCAWLRTDHHLASRTNLERVPLSADISLSRRHQTP